MNPEVYDLKLGDHVAVIIETVNLSSMELIANRLKELGASSVLNNVFSLRLKEAGMAGELERVVSQIKPMIRTGDTVLILYSDVNSLSGKFVLIKEVQPGEGIRVVDEG